MTTKLKSIPAMLLVIFAVWITLLTCCAIDFKVERVPRPPVTPVDIVSTYTFTAQEVSEALKEYCVNHGKGIFHHHKVILTWHDDEAINRDHPKAVDYVWDSARPDNNPVRITLKTVEEK